MNSASLTILPILPPARSNLLDAGINAQTFSRYKELVKGNNFILKQYLLS